MYKISVIIPIYNTEKYLAKCLDSICNQTLSDVEIICINDCSTDNSLGFLEQYAKNDKRIKIINFEQNKGVSAARNSGIEIAQGEFIGFIDSDDYIDLDFFENLYNKAKETCADVVKAQMVNVSLKTGQKYNTGLNSQIAENKFYFCNEFTTAIYNTTFLKQNKINFPLNISMFEDPVFSLNVILNCKHLELYNDSCYYRIKGSENQATATFMPKQQEDCLLAVIQMLELIKNESLSEDILDFLIYKIQKDFITRFVAHNVSKDILLQNIKQLNLFLKNNFNKIYDEEELYDKVKIDIFEINKKRMLEKLRNNIRTTKINAGCKE